MIASAVDRSLILERWLLLSKAVEDADPGVLYDQAEASRPAIGELIVKNLVVGDHS